MRYIEIDPEIRGGEPVIRGTRITVYGVAQRIADGDTIEALLEEYPYMPREAFEQALLYAGTKSRRRRPIPAWQRGDAGRNLSVGTNPPR